MKKFCFITLSIVFLLSVGGIANATNGDNFIAVGPIARAMGGVGIAAPQDAISAVFANPAGMCFGPYCPGTQIDFTGTVFFPSVHGEISAPGAGIYASARSQSNIFIIPAIGVSTPLSSDPASILSKFRFGVAAYGNSGLGTDYRDKLVTGIPQTEIFTQFQVMKFAPTLAYRVTGNLSVGVNFQVSYEALDLGSGTSNGFGFGGQIGAIYKIGPVSLGLSYLPPQTISHKRVYDFDGDGMDDTLKLQMPHTLGFGIAYQPLSNLLIEGDFKWINWSGATGYKDFDWGDQYVFAFGVQYNPIPKLSLRAGVNYGNNPVKEHDGFDAAGTTIVQGKSTSTFGYEYLRIIGFPAIAETHLTFGIGYKFSEKFAINIGYMHAFEKKISETGINFGGPGGPPVSLSSKLAEDAVDIGLTWTF